MLRVPMTGSSSSAGVGSNPPARWWPASGDADEVAFGVAEEGEIFVLAGRAELSGFVVEDDVWFGLDRDAGRAEMIRRGGDIVYSEVEQG